MNGAGGFRLGFLTLLVVASFVSPAIEGDNASGAESPKPRCALVIATPSPTATLLEAALLETGTAEWLERGEIDRILAEQKLDAAFAARAVKSRVALGRLLKADLLVLVQIQPAEPATEPSAEPPAGRIDLVVAETAGGMRILAQAVPQTNDPAADARKALAPIASALRKYAETIREVYAVPPFLSRDLGHQNDHLMSAYAKLVEQVLLAQPGVLVVEIEEAETIAREIALAGPDDRLVRPMPLYLMGEYRHEGLGDAQKVTIALQTKRGNATLSQASETMSPPEVPAYLQQVAAGLLARGEAKTARFDPQAEASHLAQRSADFLKLRDWRQALALAEASLLLDPDRIEPRAGAIQAISRIVQGREPQTRRQSVFDKPSLSEPDVAKRVTLHADVLRLRRRAFEHLQHALAAKDADRVSDLTIQTALGSRRCGRYPSHVPEPLAPALWQQVEMERDFALERAYHHADRGQWDRSQVFLELARDRMMPARAADESLKFLAKYHHEPGCLGPFGVALSDATPTSVEVLGMCSQVLAWDDLNRQVELRIRHAQKVAEAKKDYFARSRAASQAAKAAPFEAAGASPKLGFRQVNISCEASTGPIDDLTTCLALDDGSDVFFGRNGNIYHVAEPGKATLIWKPLHFGSKRYDPRRSVATDGRYLWIVYDIEAALGQRLFVVDPIDGRNWEIERQHGLPAVKDFVKGVQGPKPSPMLVAPIRPGEAIVAASHGDTWIAHVRFDPEGNHRVHVFHEAQIAHSHEPNGPGDADHDDSWKNSHVAIVPSHISVWEIAESAKLVMIGRHVSDVNCPIFADHPLLVNPADLSVAVMQHEWKNRRTRIDISALNPREQYSFDAVDDEIHLMYRKYPERDPVRLFSGIQEGCLVVDGDSVHVVGRRWQQGSLSTGQWHSLGETPWQFWAESRSGNGKALPKRPFSLYGIGRSNLYGFVANYGCTIDRRTRRKLVQVTFDGTGLPLSKLPSLKDAPRPLASLSVKPREATPLPKPRESLAAGRKRRVEGRTSRNHRPGLLARWKVDRDNPTVRQGLRAALGWRRTHRGKPPGSSSRDEPDRLQPLRAVLRRNVSRRNGTRLDDGDSPVVSAFPDQQRFMVPGGDLSERPLCRRCSLPGGRLCLGSPQRRKTLHPFLLARAQLLDAFLS